MIAKIRLRSGILRRRATNLVGFDSSAILRAASPALLMAPQATERSLRSSSIIDRAGSISPAESLRVRTNPHGRLIIRALVPDDVAVIHARRNNPDVARLQNWEVPFPLERAQDLVDTCIALGEPTDGEWWNAMVTLPDGTPVGDLGVNLTWEGRSAEVGYSFDPEHWGNGYASESLAALVDHLFDTRGVTRVFGMLDPANTASAQVLERVGMLYEGRTRSSFWKDDEVSDDWYYGMLREDRDAWVTRPRNEPEVVEYVEVTADNFDTVAKLRTHHTQEAFVVPMLWSFADALFPGEEDGLPVIP